MNFHYRFFKPFYSSLHPLPHSLKYPIMARSSKVAQAAASVSNTTIEDVSEDERRPTKRTRKGKAKIEEDEPCEHHEKATLKKSAGKKKKAGANVAVDTSDFLPRVDSKWKVGAHVSAAGGVENAIVNAATIGANAFALYLKPQRKWTSSAMSAESIRMFKKRMEEFKYTPEVVLPHGSYLVNLGNPDEEKREQSYRCFLDDLKRCEQLGLKYHNFHPGSTLGSSKEESLSNIAKYINRAHSETEHVVTVIENMAGTGSILGKDFKDIKKIIDQVEDKSRVGVCMDTCHTFAAGYDIRTEENWNNTMTKFDEEIGMSYLCGMHLNDSKFGFHCKRDRHENIGMGHIGIEAFRHIVNDTRIQNVALILETPSFEKPKEVWGKEIAVLQALSKSTMEDEDNVKIVKEVLGEDLDVSNTEELVNLIKGAVKSAEASGKPKGKAKAPVKTTKRKRKGAEEDDDDDDDE